MADQPRRRIGLDAPNPDPVAERLRLVIEGEVYEAMKARLRATEVEVSRVQADALWYGDGWLRVTRLPNGTLRYRRVAPDAVMLSCICEPAVGRNPDCPIHEEGR